MIEVTNVENNDQYSMQTEIYVRHGLKKRMSEELGFCKNTIRCALLGLTDNDNARLIRKRAIGFYGGVELKRGFCRVERGGGSGSETVERPR